MEAREVPRLRALLRALRQRYEFVSLAEAVILARSMPILDGRFLAFSFDDGFRDNYDFIAPTLDEFGGRCCFFVATNFIDCDDQYREWFLRTRVCAPPSKESMSWSMLMNLVAEGFEIGAHTVDHVNLAKVSVVEADRQMRQSRDTIRARLGVQCRWFAWPYGRYEHMPPAVLARARELFEGVFSAERSSSLQSADGSVFNRDHFEPGWPESHVRYFLSRQVSAGGAAGERSFPASAQTHNIE